MAGVNLSKSTGQIDAAKAYEIAQPIVAGWKERFAKLRTGGKTATQVKAEHLAKKYARVKKAGPSRGRLYPDGRDIRLRRRRTARGLDVSLA